MEESNAVTKAKERVLASIKRIDEIRPIENADANEFLQGDLEEQIARADGRSELNPATIREGLVFKNLKTQESFKIVSNKFLEKQN